MPDFIDLALDSKVLLEVLKAFLWITWGKDKKFLSIKIIYWRAGNMSQELLMKVS